MKLNILLSSMVLLEKFPIRKFQDADSQVKDQNGEGLLRSVLEITPCGKNRAGQKVKEGSYTVSVKVSDDIKRKCNLTMDYWNYSMGVFRYELI